MIGNTGIFGPIFDLLGIVLNTIVTVLAAIINLPITLVTGLLGNLFGG